MFDLASDCSANEQDRVAMVAPVLQHKQKESDPLPDSMAVGLERAVVLGDVVAVTLPLASDFPDDEDCSRMAPLKRPG